MNDITVWVDDWQMQCCGDPFEVGSQVEWTIVPWTFERPPIDELGAIEYYYEHHGDADTEVLQLKGTVARIQAVYQRYALDVAENVQKPVAGRLVKYSGIADGWTAGQDEYRFSAYLVQLISCDIVS